MDKTQFSTEAHGENEGSIEEVSGRSSDFLLAELAYFKRDTVTKQCLQGNSVVSKRDKGSPWHASKGDKS
jgi:hypothetical protein